MDAPICPDCGDICEFEPPNGDGCLCYSGDCPGCVDGCSGTEG